MSFQQQAELDALGKKVSEGLNQEELDKLVKLTADKAKWQAELTKKITSIVNSIKGDNVSLITLIENQAYTTKDLKAAAVHFNLIESEQKNNTSQPVGSKGEVKRVQKTGAVVFTFEKVGGFRSSQIRQDSNLPATPNDSHIAFYLKPGSTKEKLMKLKEKTADNEVFLKSAEGIQLVNDWVNWFDTKVSKYVENHPEKAGAKA